MKCERGWEKKKKEDLRSHNHRDHLVDHPRRYHRDHRDDWDDPDPDPDLVGISCRRNRDLDP